jgi:uncharacterized protein
MIQRPELLRQVDESLARSPIAILLGPRQCGKTTLARQFAANVKNEFFDLELPTDLARLSVPMLALEGLGGLVVIDEAQRKPELFNLLRVLVDRPGNKAKFLLTGSASPHLVRGASESLAGRIAFVEMSGFDLREIGCANFRQLWLRGGFPRSYLADTERASCQWRSDFIRTFLERDVPQLGISIPAQRLARFWTMVAHYHGQIFNAAEFGRSLGISETTARRYLDLLCGAYVVRQLQPWHANLKKRQVKSPKVYVRDSGLLHTLLSIESDAGLAGHPKFGASWEGFALEQVLAVTDTHNAYFWAVHSSAEIDLFLIKNEKRYGFEFKCADAPEMTHSMATAIADLKLDKLLVVYPGAKSYALDARVSVVSIMDVESVLASNR